jgi:DNA-directed RNA polymerase specialized sigma24 family protein
MKCDELAIEGVDVEKIIHSSAWRASKHLSPGLTREDLKQEGRLALLLAQRDGKLPTDPTHCVHYLYRRLYGAMVDANRAAWDQQPMEVDELTDDTPTRAAVEQPERAYQLRQAVENVIRRGPARLEECLDLLAFGYDGVVTANLMHLDQSSVSKLRHEARELFSLYC